MKNKADEVVDLILNKAHEKLKGELIEKFSDTTVFLGKHYGNIMVSDLGLSGNATIRQVIDAILDRMYKEHIDIYLAKEVKLLYEYGLRLGEIHGKG